MEINKQTVEVLANTLKIEPSVLTEQLTSSESKISEFISDKEVFTKSELETLKANVNKESYEKGKIAGREMELKEVKEEFGYKGVEGLKDLRTFVNYVVSDKTKSNGQPDEVVKQLKTEKLTLQESLKAIEQEKQKMAEAFEQYKANQIVSQKIDFALGSITIDADESLANAQKGLLKEKLMRDYSVKLIDGREYVVNSTGERLVDRTGEPVPLADIVKSEAPKYVRLKSIPEGGRGGSSSKTNNLSGEFASIKTKDELEVYLKNKNINPQSQEAIAIFRKVKQDNPDFK